MSDLFHESLPDEAIDKVFAVMALSPQHTFQILTKRPERLRDYIRRHPDPVMDVMAAATGEQIAALKWPLPHVHLGVSVENQETADTRIPLLLATPAAIRFVSYEPALGPVDFSCIPWPKDHQLGTDDISDGFDSLRFDDRNSTQRLGRLDWVIVGGESGPGARPFHVDWARTAIAQCADALIAAFMKQFGSRIIGDSSEFSQYGIAWTAEDGSFGLNDRKGGDPISWPEWARVRQFPGEAAA
jgi:protein gp37